MKFYSQIGGLKLFRKNRGLFEKIFILNLFVLGIMLSSQTMAMATYYGTASNGWTHDSTEATATGFNGQANNNTITDSTSEIYGGYSADTDVTNNFLTVSEGTDLSGIIASDGLSVNSLRIMAGYSENSESHNATNNHLTIGKNVKLRDDWGYAFWGALAGANANANSVSILGPMTAANSTFTIYGGGSSSGSASYNTVNITDAITTAVYGGYTDSGTTEGNIVNISGGTFNLIYGGYSLEGEAKNNQVYLTGNITLSQNAEVYGGRGNNSDSTLCANNNLIYLDAQVNSDTPGTVRNLKLVSSLGDMANSSGNKIVIGKNAVIGNDITLDLYAIDGNYQLYPTTESAVEFWAKDLSVNSVQTSTGTFKNLYFVLPQTVQNNDIILSVANPISLTGTSIGVATQSGVNLEIDDQITLIDQTDAGTYQQLNMNNVSLVGGSFTTDYTFGLSTTGINNALIATVTGKNANDETAAPAEGQVSTMALLNTGSDLIANVGLEKALVATKENQGHLAPFAAVAGGYSQYKTGSHINLASASLLTGFAKNITDDAMAGLFVETGYGDYTTHNHFTKGKVKGNGDSQYYGLGFMGRYDFGPNLYAEGSIHGGYLNNSWKSNDTTVPVDYHTDSLYYGTHLGLGYETALTATCALNVYGKYFYTHQEGDKATLDGTQFIFKDIDSHLTRLGARLYYTLVDNVKPFMGIAWDYEFDGKAKSYAGNTAVNAPRLQGNTGMLEFGLKADNLKQTAWDMDISLQGFVGQREGIQGLVKAKYNF